MDRVLAGMTPGGTRLFREWTVESDVPPPPLPDAEPAPPVALNATAPRGRRLQQAQGDTRVLFRLLLAPQSGAPTLDIAAVDTFALRILKDGPRALWAAYQGAQADDGTGDFRAPMRLALMVRPRASKYTALPGPEDIVLIGGAGAATAAPVGPSEDGLRGWQLAVVVACVASVCCCIVFIAVFLTLRHRGKNVHAARYANGAPKSGQRVQKGGRGSSSTWLPDLGVLSATSTRRKVSAFATRDWVAALPSDPDPAPLTHRHRSGELTPSSVGRATAPTDGSVDSASSWKRSGPRTASELVSDVTAHVSGAHEPLLPALQATQVRALRELQERTAFGPCTFQEGFEVSDQASAREALPHSLRVAAHSSRGAAYELHLYKHVGLFRNERALLERPDLEALFEKGTEMGDDVGAAINAWDCWKLVRGDGTLSSHLRCHKQRRHAWPFLETMRVLGQTSMRLDALHRKGVRPAALCCCA